MRRFRAQAAALAAVVWFAAFPVHAQTPNSAESDPTAALTAALSAACRANPGDFSNYLTAANAVAFRALSSERREAFLKRFSLSDSAGRPLISTGADNRPVFRCQSPAGTTEFRFGASRMDGNLALIPANVKDTGEMTFGLVQQGGAWRLISLGLVFLDIPQLAKQWDEDEIAAHENAAIATLHALADAVESYRRAYGKLPDSLAQLGPAPKDEVSPDQAGLIDADLANGTAGGYQFRYRIASSGDASASDAMYELAAAPAKYGAAGRRSFLLDAIGKLHAADKHGALASGDDPIVAGVQSATDAATSPSP